MAVKKVPCLAMSLSNRATILNGKVLSVDNTTSQVSDAPNRTSRDRPRACTRDIFWAMQFLSPV